MASASVAMGSWIIIALLGGASALPIGGPPLPLDLALSAMAPDECLWYVASSGIGAANPDSENQTEKLFAEPQIQRFAEELETQLLRAVRRGAGAGRQQRVLLSEAPVLIRALITRPIAMYVADVRPREGGVDVDAAVVLNAGEQREAVEQSIARLLEIKPADAPDVIEETIGGVAWQRIVTQPHAPEVRWRFHDDYFVVAIGKKTPTKLLERIDGEAPQWLNEIRSEHPIEREQSIAYLNIAGVIERVRPFAEQEEAWQIAQRLGLAGLKAFHARAGFDDRGCRAMGHLVTDGQRNGLFALLPYKPLSKRDLRTIPSNPLIATACRIDAADVWDEVVRIVGQFDPHAEAEVEEALWQMESDVGVNVRDDIIRSLDDVWIGYVPGGDLMSSWLGSAAAVRVKDRAALERAIGKLVDVARANARRGRRGGISFRETNAGGAKIFTLEVTGEPFPLAPSWCVGDEWMVFGLMPQTVRDVLERSERDSLADVEQVRDILAAPDGPAVISYQDTPRIVRSVYPWIQAGLHAVASQLRAEGFDIDATALPSSDVIARHLRPGVSTVTHGSDGFHFTAHTSLPGGGNLAAAAPIGVAMLLPAVQSARRAAHSVQEINHLKQIALAVHNYHDTMGRFPSNIYDEDGKALLSWRVQLLPYLEQQALFDQIQMDEPWDSPANRRMGQVLPVTYSSVSEEIPPGKTRCVALASPLTIMPGDEKLSFRNIRDGTSNTILCVQASPDAAVDWMKPDDIEFDPESPFAGLESVHGSFTTALCDGSVHTISLAIPEDAMRALATRDGREVVDHNVFRTPPAQVRPVEVHGDAIFLPAPAAVPAPVVVPADDDLIDE
ncbi:DUF1559 domain-containing protein [Pirellulales bacterium]|nr:DUF1559 domain-containing protein [Pirellulales bacterium]